jgi:hypothetical protein
MELRRLKLLHIQNRRVRIQDHPGQLVAGGFDPAYLGT